MSGIRDLIPGSVIDATMFNPCGYSMNGMKSDVSFMLINNQHWKIKINKYLGVIIPFFFFFQGTYWTIHITPEPEFSYVSFETNISQTSYDDLIRKVVEVFKPGKFVTTLFVNQVSFLALAYQLMEYIQTQMMQGQRFLLEINSLEFASIVEWYFLWKVKILFSCAMICTKSDLQKTSETVRCSIPVPEFY